MNSFFRDLYDSPEYPSPNFLRVDASPHLLVYHKTDIGPKPTPTATPFLPLRTHLPIAMAQTHAYYEEIDSIPAASVGQTSAFSAGHWWVIHPVPRDDLFDMSTDMLRALERWIEVDVPNELFVRQMVQVVEFQWRRQETLEGVKEELRRRERRMAMWEEREGVEEEGEEVEVESWYTDAALEEVEQKGKEAVEEAHIRDEYEFA